VLEASDQLFPMHRNVTITLMHGRAPDWHAIGSRIWGLIRPMRSARNAYDQGVADLRAQQQPARSPAAARYLGIEEDEALEMAEPTVPKASNCRFAR
jgi:hypothetical protein